MNRLLLITSIFFAVLASACSSEKSDEPTPGGTEVRSNADTESPQAILQQGFIESNQGVCLLSEGETEIPGAYDMRKFDAAMGDYPMLSAPTTPGAVSIHSAFRVNKCESLFAYLPILKPYPITADATKIVFFPVCIDMQQGCGLTDMNLEYVSVSVDGEVIAESDSYFGIEDTLEDGKRQGDGFFEFNILPNRSGKTRDIVFHFITKEIMQPTSLTPGLEPAYGKLEFTVSQNPS